MEDQINQYIESQAESKRSDLKYLHKYMLEFYSGCKLWFLDGKDEKGKVIANSNIGYGSQLMNYANGKSKEFYQVGISANTTGISVYVMGMSDKNYLLETYGKSIGKASVTGYCIKFKRVSEIHFEVLKQAISDGMKQ